MDIAVFSSETTEPLSAEVVAPVAIRGIVEAGTVILTNIG